MPPAIGCSIGDLDTPALCIDLDVMESNIRRMAELCRQNGKQWRPHTKAVKSPLIARWEIEAGAHGITCAKLGEAEVMAAGGIRDILIANLIVGPQKLTRLAALCRAADPIVVVDHPTQVEMLGEAMSRAGVTLRVLVEVDIGLKRVGIAPGEPALRLGQMIHRTPGLKLAGIMGYEGHLLTIEDPEEKDRRIREAMAVLAETREAYLRAGLPCEIVSAGGTGSCAITVTCPGVTELQAGGLIFMDAFYRHRCGVTAFDFALKLVATIVGRPAPDRAIIDAGRKSHHADSHNSLVAGRGDVRVVRLSAEHGELQLDESARGLSIGDRIELIPGYSDMTNVLHDEFYALRRGKLERIIPLEGRGKLR